MRSTGGLSVDDEGIPSIGGVGSTALAVGLDGEGGTVPNGSSAVVEADLKPTTMTGIIVDVERRSEALDAKLGEFGPANTGELEADAAAMGCEAPNAGVVGELLVPVVIGVPWISVTLFGTWRAGNWYILHQFSGLSVLGRWGWRFGAT